MKDLKIEIELQALITEREGMSIENLYRLHCNNALAYTEDSFFVLADKIRALAEKVSEPDHQTIVGKVDLLNLPKTLQCSICNVQCVGMGKVAGDLCPSIDCPGVLGKG